MSIFAGGEAVSRAVVGFDMWLRIVYVYELIYTLSVFLNRKMFYCITNESFSFMKLFSLFFCGDAQIHGLCAIKLRFFQEIHKSRELVFKFCFTMITSLMSNVVNSSWGTNNGCRVRGFFVRGVFGKGFVFRKGGRNVTDSFLINKTSISYSNRSSTTYTYNAPSFVIYSFKNIDFHT